MTKIGRLIVMSVALGLLAGVSPALALTSCRDDGDCPGNLAFCRLDGVCASAACSKDSQCGKEQACHQRVCVDTCNAALSCATGEVCQPSGLCTRKSCATAADCQECSSDSAVCQHIDTACDKVDKVCLQTCTKDADCGPAGRCYGDGTCLKTACAQDSDCGRTGFICRKDDSRCVAEVCRYDSDCRLNELCLGEKCLQDPTLYVQGDVGNCRAGGAQAAWLLLSTLFSLALLRRRIRH